MIFDFPTSKNHFVLSVSLFWRLFLITSILIKSYLRVPCAFPLCFSPSTPPAVTPEDALAAILGPKQNPWTLWKVMFFISVHFGRCSFDLVPLLGFLASFCASPAHIHPERRPEDDFSWQKLVVHMFKFWYFDVWAGVWHVGEIWVLFSDSPLHYFLR